VSPIAARLPLSERVQAAPPLTPMPSVAPSGAPSVEHPVEHPAARSGAGAPPPHPPGAADDAGAPEGLLLSRRVPQAHLAPELRRHGQASASAPADGPLPDAAEARAALSRYQASRQAARAVVDETPGPGGRADELEPERPPNAGGWS
jgi:hypothetical protein